MLAAPLRRARQLVGGLVVATALLAATPLPEPVIVQGGGPSDGILGITPGLSEVARDPSVWRLDVANGGEVAVTLRLTVTDVAAQPDGTPSPGAPIPWAATPTTTIHLEPTEVAQFGIALMPPDDFDDVIMARLTSLDTAPVVTVDALAVVGGLSAAGAAGAFVNPDPQAAAVAVELTSRDGRPAMADILVERRSGLFGLGSATVLELLDVLVLGAAPRRIELDAESTPSKLTVTSADATSTITQAGGLEVTSAAWLGIAGAAALLGGGTWWLLLRRRIKRPD